MNRFYLFIYFTTCFICTSGQKKIDSSNYVILPKSSMWSPYRDDKKFKTTSLSESEIIQIEILLQKCIDAYNISQTKEYNLQKKKFLSRGINLEDFQILLDRYRRQFITAINSKGEKEVWVNCFRFTNPTAQSYWKSRVVFVNDGGNYFFNLKTNLATKKYFDFRVNGYP